MLQVARLRVVQHQGVPGRPRYEERDAITERHKGADSTVQQALALAVEPIVAGAFVAEQAVPLLWPEKTQRLGGLEGAREQLH